MPAAWLSASCSLQNLPFSSTLSAREMTVQIQSHVTVHVVYELEKGRDGLAHFCPETSIKLNFEVGTFAKELFNRMIKMTFLELLDYLQQI